MKTIKYPVVELHIIQPQSFMNLSGGPLLRYVDSIGMKRTFKMNRILVICDEVRLPFGKIRLNVKGSSGGHNGLHDIEKKLGNNSYHRLRIGITNSTLLQANFDPLHYVLSKFDLEERDQFPQIFDKTNKVLMEYIHKDKDSAMKFANSQ
jgi:PTH1 family peptidyl-tRNA hydrolase